MSGASTTASTATIKGQLGKAENERETRHMHHGETASPAEHIPRPCIRAICAKSCKRAAAMPRPAPRGARWPRRRGRAARREAREAREINVVMARIESLINVSYGNIVCLPEMRNVARHHQSSREICAAPHHRHQYAYRSSKWAERKRWRACGFHAWAALNKVVNSEAAAMRRPMAHSCARRRSAYNVWPRRARVS